MILIRKVQGGKDLAMHCAIRKVVFQDEQGVSEREEYDKYDKSNQCRYYLAFWNEVPVGAARWRKSKAGQKIERICVLPEYRGNGIGKALIAKLLEDIPKNLQIYLGSQDQVVPFYEQLGFRVKGDAYWEANILHRFMKYKPEEVLNK